MMAGTTNGASASVETALGPISTGSLGRVLMHEHVFTVETEFALNYPKLAWNGTREQRIQEAIQTLRDLKAGGIDTVVDMNVLGLGRSIEDIQAVADQVDMNILLATGIYPEHGLPGAIRGRKPDRTATGGLSDVLADIFIDDIRLGIGGSNIKAALVKGYTDLPGVTPEIDRCLRAAAWAHRQTGVPISTHTTAGTKAGLEQQRVFREEGVDLTRVLIGHSGDTTDLGYLREMMDAGSTIGSDRFGIYPTPALGEALTTFPGLEERVSVVAQLCELGYADRIVLSHDAHTYADYDYEGGPINRTTMPHWHLAHITQQVIPALQRAGVTDAQLDQMFVDNPRRIFDHGPGY